MEFEPLTGNDQSTTAIATEDPFAKIGWMVLGEGSLSTMTIEPFAFSVGMVKFEEDLEAGGHDGLFEFVSRR
ncbi:MAG: hypothetical protein WBW47_05790 [Thermoplasmata archaeon]